MTEKKTMKEKKHTPPSPILFYVSNVAPNNLNINFIFSAIVFLLLVEESEIHGFFDYMKEYFTPDQLRLLSDRFREKRNKEVSINQQHLIIFYSIFHLTLLIFNSNKEMVLMDDIFLKSDVVENFESLKSLLFVFSNNTQKNLRKDYLNNNRITVAFAKIDAYRFK